MDDVASARPRSFWRTCIAASAALALVLQSVPAARADVGLGLIRDTETERMIRGYLDPILKAAGLQPESVHLYIVNDPSINAFVAGGQNIFVNTGTIMQLDVPNQLIGVLAHETGHMAGGHLIRTQQGVASATVPMLIAMAAGVAAMIAGSGDAGMAAISAGQTIAERDFLSFTRSQEASADQAGVKYLEATHQSGKGLLDTFRKFAEDEILTDRPLDRFALTHPTSTQRIATLRNLVESSPYYDTPDSPEAIYAYQMLQAKLRGYILSPPVVLRQYPTYDTSKQARYARAMAYFRMPDMEKALAEINSLVAEEPNNPYFLEVLGQIQVERSKPQLGIEPYARAVAALPDAPLLRIALASAMIAVENPALLPDATKELQVALRQEPDNTWGWYEAAQAYGRQNMIGEADLATAEQHYSNGSYQQAVQFAFRAQRKLVQGSIDWQRANDIMTVAQTQMPAKN